MAGASPPYGVALTADPARPVLPPVAPKQYGAAITEKVTTPLDALQRRPGSLAGKVLRIEGAVSAVDRSAGAWMALDDGDGLGVVLVAGQGFVLPRGAAGHRVVVQGRVAMPERNEPVHEAEAATGVSVRATVEATGVELID